MESILTCADLYFKNVSRLQAERGVLTSQLRSSSSIDMCDADALAPCLDKLLANLKGEHVLRIMLNRFMWSKLLTPVQCSKAAVYRCVWLCRHV